MLCTYHPNKHLTKNSSLDPPSLPPQLTYRQTLRVGWSPSLPSLPSLLLSLTADFRLRLHQQEGRAWRTSSDLSQALHEYLEGRQEGQADRVVSAVVFRKVRDLNGLDRQRNCWVNIWTY